MLRATSLFKASRHASLNISILARYILSKNFHNVYLLEKLTNILNINNNEKIFSIEDLAGNEAMVKEALGLLQSIIAELKEHGFCKLEITARVAQDKMVFGDPDCLCGTSPYDGSELASFILDKELLSAVGNACRWCRTPRDVNDRVLSLLRQSKAWNSRIFLSKPFLASLVPLLTNFKKKPNSSLLYTAIWKQL